MKRRILASVTLAAVIGLAAAPAEAAVSAVGWWTRNPTASAPEGGLQVANGLDGTLSFGAVRAVEDGVSIEKAVLTLQESGQAVNGAGASLQACPALGTWSPGQGTFADAPKADCQAATVALTRNAAGQWTGDVTSVLVGGTPALAVVPGEGGGIFQVSFDPPTLDVKMRASSGSASGSSSSGFDASEFTAPATTTPSGGSSGSGDSSDFSGSGSQSSTFQPSSSSSFSSSSSSSGSAGSTGGFAPTADAPAAATEVATAEGGDATETTGADEGSSGSSFVAQGAVAGPSGDGGNRWAQFGLFLVVAAVIGTAAGVGRNRLTARSA